MSEQLREAYALQLKALRALRREIANRDRKFQELMDAVRASDEAAANMGHTGAPCCDPPAKGYETKTHQFAAQRLCGGICTDGDDPPSRTP